jgi:hypothetical protein
LLRGTFASRPTAAAGNSGLYYLATDNNGGTVYQSTGSAWVQVAAGATHGATHSTGGPDALSGNIDAIGRLAIATSGTVAGSRRKLNLIPGANVTIAAVDDSANEKVDATIGLTGVAQAAGFAKMTVGTVAPTSPAMGDIWVDTN